MKKTPIKLSNTAITMYNDCARKFKYHYIDKLVSKEKGSPLYFGAAVDEGLTHLLKTKDLQGALFRFHRFWAKQSDNTYTKVRLRDNPNVKYSKSDLDEHLLTAADRKHMEKSQCPVVEWYSLKRKGELLIKAYYDQILPLIDTVDSTQLVLTLDDGNGNILKGVIDLVCKMKDGRFVILDNKTSSVKYTEESVKESFQLSLYKLLAQENGMEVDGLGYLVLNKKVGKKGIVNTQVIINDSVNDDDLNVVLDKVNEVLDNIKQENFIPNFNSCKSYFGKCQFYNKCHENDDSNLICIKKEE
jgi:hypothetical protein